nr:hypothetical protein [Agrobacterium fabrum]
MALRRIRSRRGSCSLHGHVDNDGKAQRHRSAGVAGRRSCPPTRRLSGWSSCFRGIGRRRPSTLKLPDLWPSPEAYGLPFTP